MNTPVQILRDVYTGTSADTNRNVQTHADSCVRMRNSLMHRRASTHTQAHADTQTRLVTTTWTHLFLY